MSQFGTIKIFIENKKVYTGTRLNGQINIQLIQPIPTNMIILELKGKEKVKMGKRVVDHHRTNHYSHHYGNNRNHHNQVHYKSVFEEDSEEIINLKIPLYNKNGYNFGVGNNVIPFFIDVKDGLPSTFLYTYNFYGKECKAEIKYRLEAFLQIPNSKTLKDELKFEMIETLPLSQQGPSFFHKNLFIKKQKDCYSFSGQLQKDFFQFGENANAVIGCDNTKNSTSIKKLKWKYVQYLKFHTRDNRMVKFERNRITKANLDKVKHGKSVLKNIVIPITSSDKNGFSNVPSFKTKLISCIYKIEFYAVSRFMLIFSKNHKVDIEIKVFKKNNKMLKPNPNQNFNNNGNQNINDVPLNPNMNNNPHNQNMNNNPNNQNMNNNYNPNFNNNIDDNQIDINPVNYPEL